MSRSLPRGSEGVNEIGLNCLEVLWMVITAVIFIALAVMGKSVWGRDSPRSDGKCSRSSVLLLALCAGEPTNISSCVNCR